MLEPVSRALGQAAAARVPAFRRGAAGPALRLSESEDSVRGAPHRRLSRAMQETGKVELTPEGSSQQEIHVQVREVKPEPSTFVLCCGDWKTTQGTQL